MTDTISDMQNITQRLLALWQEQMSLMSQNPEMMNYGESMFKAMGMKMPEGFPMPASQTDAPQTSAPQQETAPNDDLSSSATNSGSQQSAGAETSSLSPEQRAAMVDELSQRINELAGKIAEHEGNAVSSDPEGKS